jgi:hypothetical protein
MLEIPYEFMIRDIAVLLIVFNYRAKLTKSSQPEKRGVNFFLLFVSYISAQISFFTSR